MLPMSLNYSFLITSYALMVGIKDTSERDWFASHLDLHFKTECEGHLRRKPYDKRDYFGYSIKNYPIICNNIPAAPPYGV